MKKYILIASAALLTLAACTKVQEAAPQQEISFQVANYVATKANVAFSNKDFGVFDWHHAEDGTVTAIMKNERVGQKGTEWRTLDNTYYWPKSGSLNFISYSPYSADKAPAITETSIGFKAYEVTDVDLMYADRANAKTKNESTYTAISGANGVPTLFRHALAKLSFRIKVNFTEATTQVENPAATANDAGQTQDNKTTWEVTLYKVVLTGVYNTGDLNLTLDRDNVSWTKPAGNVWTPDTAKKMADLVLFEAENGEVLTTTPKDLLTDKDGKAQSFFVLPQALGTSDPQNKVSAQQLVLHFKIKTTQPNLDAEGKPIVQEEVINKAFDLSEISTKIKAWQMNQNIFYTIGIKPTAAFDPDKPDEATDAVITFDPTLEDWELVDENAVIQL